MDIERMKQRYEELNKKRENRGKDFWNPRPGPNEIRVLPSWTGDPSDDFYVQTAYHRNLGPEKSKNCVCLKAEGKDSCPICEVVKELYASNDKENAAWAKDIRARDRVYWNIVDMGEYNEAMSKGKEPKGVQIWGSGPDVLHQFLGYCVNIKYGDLTDPIKGRNITLVFTKAEDSKSGYNDYVVQPDPERSPIAEVEWLDNLADLKAIVKPIEPEKMKAMMSGEDIDEKPEQQSGTGATQPEPEKQKTADEPRKACRGKYDKEDTECGNCLQKDPCIEERKARLSQTKEVTKKVADEKPAAKPVEKPAAVSTTDKATEVEKMMLKIRDKQAKKKEAMNPRSAVVVSKPW